MDFSFATFAALCALFTAALCAPVEPQDACADVRSSSVAFNDIARTVSLKVRNANAQNTDWFVLLLQEPHESKKVPAEYWEEAPLCHYTMDRLFSFSIFTARVFAVGDPTRHNEGSAQKCM
uniref:Uncharacterized protein n=1 Tax=Stegastes partitus TaxID=144197 RepID=A0A3B5B127_9TELE